MRFISLHFLTSNSPVAVNVHMIGYVHPITIGGAEGSEIYVQGQPSGETLKVKESVQDVLNRIAFVTQDYLIK